MNPRHAPDSSPEALLAPVVCVVTRVRGVADSSERDQLLSRLAAAAAAGASMIQVRERQVDDRTLLHFVRVLIGAVAGTGCRVLVNDRTDVALAAKADGIHLKSDAPPADSIRRLTPPGFLIGRSVHTVDEAVE